MTNDSDDWSKDTQAKIGHLKTKQLKKLTQKIETNQKHYIVNLHMKKKPNKKMDHL